MKEFFDGNLRTTEQAEKEEAIEEGIQRALDPLYGKGKFMGFYGEPKWAYLKRYVDEPSAKKHFKEIKEKLDQSEEGLDQAA
jgi:hypothetical protein